MSLAIACAGLASAAPVDHAQSVEVAAQNVDYIGVDSGRALDLGFPVLVPSWVPAPFGGSPSVDAGGGYYSLYWMNGGGDPTFLQVTGSVGGGLPAGSPYDLNNELFINASVMGHEAIHDVTPAYDAVWWIAGGVLYKVESRNSGADSLTLANSLITFVPPSAPEPPSAPVEPTPVPVEPTPVPVEPTAMPVAPADDPATSLEDTTGQQEPGDSGVVVEQEAQSDVFDSGPSAPGNPAASSTASPGETPDSPATTTTDVAEQSLADEDSTLSDGTGQPFASSDGTGGPTVVIGGDGTGGTNDVAVSPNMVRGRETP